MLRKLSESINTKSSTIKRLSFSSFITLTALLIGFAAVTYLIKIDNAKAMELDGRQSPVFRMDPLISGLPAPTGISDHHPSNSLLIISREDGSVGNLSTIEQFSASGRREFIKYLYLPEPGAAFSIRNASDGFESGELFLGTGRVGELARISSDGSHLLNPWITLPGESGVITGIGRSNEGLFDSDLIAVTSKGGVWRIDSQGYAVLITRVYNSNVETAEGRPLKLSGVAILPDTDRYGPWAGKIITASEQTGLFYAVATDGRTESFDTGIRNVRGMQVIPEGNNLYGITSDIETGKAGILWGAGAYDLSNHVGDILIANAGRLGCKCPPSLMVIRWADDHFITNELFQLPDDSQGSDWVGITFSPLGLSRIQQQQNEAIPVIGPFGQPTAVGPTNNNDDFSLIEATVVTSGGVTTAPINVRFINTLRNIGNAIGNFIISAPVIPAGFNVSVSVDSGATFTTLDAGKTLTTPTPVNPAEERNIDIRVTVPAGVRIDQVYEVIVQVSSDTIATLNNRTIDRIRLIEAIPDLPVVIGPFGNAEATGPTGNNDDFTLGKVSLNISNGLTTETGRVRFINTLKNLDGQPRTMVISAPTIPTGFTVMASIDSGETFTRLDNGGIIETPTAVNSQETRNIDVRIGLPAGLMVNTDYDVVIQAAPKSFPERPNKTIDRVRIDPNPPKLMLVKGVTDMAGNDLDGKTVVQGQTIKYLLTLKNVDTVSVGNSFIAEFIPPEVDYMPESVNITAGPNMGPKTDKRGDDQSDYFPSVPANGQINIFTGTGAKADMGGVLEKDQSTTVVFFARVKSNVPIGTMILNGADWGAEGFVLGGKSNIVKVTVGCPTITLSPAGGSLPSGKVGEDYSRTITQSGGTAPVMFTIDSGALPAGLTLNKTTGALTGKPTVAGDFSFTVKVTDANNCPGSQSYTLKIEAVAPPPPPPPSDSCRPIICFRSAEYYSINFGTTAIPGGTVLIGGINSQTRLQSTDPRVKIALDGLLGSLQQEYVAAQLNVLNAGGLGSPNVINAFNSPLSCYGLKFDPVMLGVGNLSTSTKLGEFIMMIESVSMSTSPSKDMCVLSKVLNALNGNNPLNVCHLVSGVVDLSSCQ